MNLTEAKPGQEVTVSCLASAGREGFRLRELGFGEGQRIRLIHKHDPLICQVGTCRIGVCRRLAACIKVNNCPSAMQAEETHDHAGVTSTVIDS